MPISCSPKQTVDTFLLAQESIQRMPHLSDSFSIRSCHAKDCYLVKQVLLLLFCIHSLRQNQIPYGELNTEDGFFTHA